MTYRLFLLQPEVVFRAQVNQSSFAYPLDSVEYDGVTVGTVGGGTFPGRTIVFGSEAGLSDLGRSYVRAAGTGTTLYFGRSSRGTRDGEVNLSDNVYIDIWDDYRVWAKIPFIDDDGTHYKDSDLAFTDQTDEPPPVCNGGPGVAATIDPSTSVITVTFPGSGAPADMAMAEGATITAYSWDVRDGTITAGTATDNIITATFPAGFRWVRRQVTDSNGKTHLCRIPVYARDPAADTSIEHFQIERHHMTRDGQEMTVRVLEDIDADTYPDGTLVMIWEDEPADAADRSHMRFIGWHQSDDAEIAATRTATLKDTVLNCVDVAGRLRTLPSFPQEIRNVVTASNWQEMTGANIKRYLHYLMVWHSTALELADWIWGDGVPDLPFVILGSDGDDLWNQINRRCGSMVPDRHLTCNSKGQLAIYIDPLLQDTADRNYVSVQRNLTVDDWADVRYTSMHAPRVHWLWGSAVLSGTAEPIGTAFCRAPGDSPGQGETSQNSDEQLSESQENLNSSEGHRYARLNAPQSPFAITFTGGDTFDIEPANLSQFVALNISADLAAQRGLNFTTEHGLALELDIRYEYTPAGMVRTIDLIWERETDGPPAVTYVPPESNTQQDDSEFWPGDYWSDNYEFPSPTSPFYGAPQAYILWDSAHVIRTWDIMAASPTWELVDTGVTGTIRDGQYVILDNTAGMWLMTSTAIWWCADIMAGTPAWSAVLTLATVQASDASGSTAVELKSMFHSEDSNPGYCIVATGLTGQTTGASYDHAYFWYTSNYGASWTQVDMNAFLFSSSGISRGYTLCGLHGINIHRSSGTIFALRAAQRVTSNGSFAVFVSEDYGATWAKRYTVDAAMTDTDSGALLDPFPDISDPSWLTRASDGQSIRPSLYKTTDAWVTGAQSTLPTGFNLVAGVWRPNSRTFDPDHLLAWHRNSSTTHAELLETTDGGTNWTSLYNSGVAVTTLSRSVHNTPNGWPPAPETWFMVRAVGNIGDPVIQITEDHFQTFSSREGNLNTLLSGTWADGSGSGFALPKLGANA